MTTEYAQLEAEREDDPKMAKLYAHPDGLEAWGLFARLLRRPENFIVGLFTVSVDHEAQRLRKKPAHITKLLKLLRETGFIEYDEGSGGVFIIGKMERNAGITGEPLKEKDNRVRAVLKVLDRLGHHPLFPKVFEHYPCLKPALHAYRDELRRKEKPAVPRRETGPPLPRYAADVPTPSQACSSVELPLDKQPRTQPASSHPSSKSEVDGRMAYERELAKLTEPQRAGLFTFRAVARSKEIEARRDDATARMTDLKHFRAFLARLEVEGMSVDEFKQAAGWMVRPESRYSGSNYFPRSCQWLTATWDDGTPKGIQLVLDYRKAKVQKEAASTGQPLREAGVVRRVEKDMKAYE